MLVACGSAPATPAAQPMADRMTLKFVKTERKPAAK
jgi:hypothetical protein